MNPNQQIIEEFYAGFAAHNAETMVSCYHPDIVFTDPVFGTLKGQDVSDMWHMLIERSKGGLDIAFSNVQADENRGSAQWTARYMFGKTGRPVVNEIRARFVFEDGLIVRHTDDFDLWKWSAQAFGWRGSLFGWTGLLQNRIRKTALESLRAYQAKRRN